MNAVRIAVAAAVVTCAAGVYLHFLDRDALDAHALEELAAGIKNALSALRDAVP